MIDSAMDTATWANVNDDAVALMGGVAGWLSATVFLFGFLFLELGKPPFDGRCVQFRHFELFDGSLHVRYRFRILHVAEILELPLIYTMPLGCILAGLIPEDNDLDWVFARPAVAVRVPLPPFRADQLVRSRLWSEG